VPPSAALISNMIEFIRTSSPTIILNLSRSDSTMYTKLVSLSRNLYSLNFKKEAQEILILEGVDPAEIASALGLSPMPDEPTLDICEHSHGEEMPEEAEDASDFAELMEKLFGGEAPKEKKEDKDED
jgi:hypothetical protein